MDSYPSTSNDRPQYVPVISNDDDQPAGFDTLCPECGYLYWLYGGDDTELLDHIVTTHSNANLNTNSPAS